MAAPSASFAAKIGTLRAAKRKAGELSAINKELCEDIREEMDHNGWTAVEGVCAVGNLVSRKPITKKMLEKLWDDFIGSQIDPVKHDILQATKEPFLAKVEERRGGGESKRVLRMVKQKEGKAPAESAKAGRVIRVDPAALAAAERSFGRE